jgi:hypothetical protein
MDIKAIHDDGTAEIVFYSDELFYFAACLRAIPAPCKLLPTDAALYENIHLQELFKLAGTLARLVSDGADCAATNEMLATEPNKTVAALYIHQPAEE